MITIYNNVDNVIHVGIRFIFSAFSVHKRKMLLHFQWGNRRRCHIYRNTTEFCRYIRDTFCIDKNRKAQVTESPHMATWLASSVASDQQRQSSLAS